MEKVRNVFDKTFFKHWLLHALVFWIFMIIVSTGSYMYKSLIIGSYIKFPNGTYLTSWDYFFANDLRWTLIIPLLIVTFFLELNYKWTNRNQHRAFSYVLRNSLISTSVIVFFYATVIFREFQLITVLNDLVGVVAVYTIYALGYHYTRNGIENQKRQAQNNYQKSQAELDVLKAQLNPHFFFNALNNLYGTALNENAPKTVGLIEQLSSIMRYTMGEAQNPFTDVKNEWGFIDNYWNLQEIRLPKKEGIKLSKSLFFDEKPTQIAPLLLIPFIENAFKYGVSVDNDCQINLDLSVKNQQLTMMLSNTIQKEKTFDNGNGIGIENTKKRLDLIYGSQYVLTQSQESNIYKVVLTIQLT